MEVYRLSRKRYANSLSGKGAALKGARWNSIGVELIYTAKNRSLAMAEVAVHFTLSTLPDDYMIITIHIPDNIKVKKIPETELSVDWKEFPYPVSTHKIGDDFVFENKYCALMLPSVVTKGDYNILLNPNHKEFSRIKIINIEKFPFDKRIFE